MAADYSITPTSTRTSPSYTYNFYIILKSQGLSINLPSGFEVADSISCIKSSKSGLRFFTGSNISSTNYGFIDGLNTNISGTVNGSDASVSGRRTVSGFIFTSPSRVNSDDTEFVIEAPAGYQAYGWLWGRSSGPYDATTGFTRGSSWTHRLSTVISTDEKIEGVVPILVKVHTVKFDANGGSGAPASVTAVHGGDWTCPMTLPTKAGYTCKGWATSKTATSPQYVAGRQYGPLNADLTVYAVWVPNQGTVVFNPNGGSVSPLFKVVKVGEAYGTFPTPVRPGASFLGWFTSASGGSAVSSSTKMTTSGIAIVHAHWNVESVVSSVTVTLDPNGGSVTPNALTANGLYPTLPIPSRPGYSFAGWFSNPFGNVQVNTGNPVIVDDDHTLYAKWNRGKSVITFDANGGTCGQTTKEVSIGTAAGRLPTASMDGKNFDGWYTDRENGEKVSASTVITSSLTVYAHYSTFKTTPWVTITISD